MTVDVHWSSLNYKDALAITGRGKIIRHFPMIPGIDFAGTVHASEDPRFHAGQEVKPSHPCNISKRVNCRQ
ncbi:hypothetical protein A9Y87_13510 [Salmonella enterica subsp. enterica]|nr:hypothetical protein A9Y87_13510 [Salmonella enterica subsp. enterica]